MRKVRSGSPQANERVQWTPSSDERFGLFSVLAALGSLTFGSRPKSAVADFVELP